MKNILDHVKANKHCNLCDAYNNYICFDCEEIQIKEKYPNAIYNDDCQWQLLKREVNK